MATIKYKYNQEWRNLEVPITLKTEGGAPSTNTYEYVEITGSRSLSAFPDLSPYISDLSQIAFLSWSKANTTSASATGSFSINTYIYCPLVGLALTQKSVDGFAQRGTTTIDTYINGVGDSKSYTLSGTPAELKLLSNNTESGAQYVGTINLYYKKEVE